MAEFVLDTGVVSQAAASIESMSAELESLASTVSGYDVSCEDFDFSGAKNTIASNIRACAQKIKNACSVLNEVVASHTELQNSLNFDGTVASADTTSAAYGSGSTTSGGSYSGTSSGGSSSGGSSSGSFTSVGSSSSGGGSVSTSSIVASGTGAGAAVISSEPKGDTGGAVESSEPKGDGAAVDTMDSPTNLGKAGSGGVEEIATEQTTTTQQTQQQYQEVQQTQEQPIYQEAAPQGGYTQSEQHVEEIGTPAQTVAYEETGTATSSSSRVSGEIAISHPKIETASIKEGAAIPSDSQKLFKDPFFKYDDSGYAVIDDNYIVSCTKEYGQVGDQVVLSLEDGSKVKCVIGEIRKSDDKDVWFFTDFKNRKSTEELFTKTLSSKITKIENTGVNTITIDKKIDRAVDLTIQSSSGQIQAKSDDYVSYIIKSYENVGIPIKETQDHNVHNMLTSSGFQYSEGAPQIASLKTGDILLTKNDNVVMYVGDGRLVVDYNTFEQTIDENGQLVPVIGDSDLDIKGVYSYQYNNSNNTQFSSNTQSAPNGERPSPNGGPGQVGPNGEQPGQVGPNGELPPEQSA